MSNITSKLLLAYDNDETQTYVQLREVVIEGETYTMLFVRDSATSTLSVETPPEDAFDMIEAHAQDCFDFKR